MCELMNRVQISIHTPTRGATLSLPSSTSQRLYFNPHSHEGSDHSSNKHPLNYYNFNPHSHEGSDIGKLCSKISTISFQSTLPRGERPLSAIETLLKHEISIHTPTRGATPLKRLKTAPSSYFNPHSHEGSDCGNRGKVPNKHDFNPHSHEGSDLIVSVDASFLLYFNPHSHEGSDSCNGGKSYPSSLFQSTLPRGERHNS